MAVSLSEDGATGALAEVNCETDFVAKQDDFRDFVAAVANRALAEQPADLDALGSVRMEGASVEERRRELIARIGENISVRRFATLGSAGGRIGFYLHGGAAGGLTGRIGVLIDLTGGGEETGKNIAMHIAASRPACISEADMPEGMLDKEREILEAQVADSGKPDDIREKMVNGRLRKFVSEITLLGQPFVKNPEQSVEKYLKEAGASVNSFCRFEVGEGMEKKSGNFAEEVMAQVR